MCRPHSQNGFAWRILCRSPRVRRRRSRRGVCRRSVSSSPCSGRCYMRAFALSAALVLAITAQIPLRPSSELSNLLQIIRVSRHDLSNVLPSGKPVVNTISENESGEIGVAGAIRIGVPLSFFLQSFAEIPTLERGQHRLEIHEFSNPPRLGDLNKLPLK